MMLEGLSVARYGTNGIQTALRQSGRRHAFRPNDVPYGFRNVPTSYA